MLHITTSLIHHKLGVKLSGQHLLSIVCSVHGLSISARQKTGRQAMIRPSQQTSHDSLCTGAGGAAGPLLVLNLQASIRCCAGAAADPVS